MVDITGSPKIKSGVMITTAAGVCTLISDKQHRAAPWQGRQAPWRLSAACLLLMQY
jgi:hypothetical protein